MKTRILIALLLGTTVMAQSAKLSLTAKNPNNIDIKDASVVVRFDDLKKISPANREKTAVYIDGKQISSQLDDLNKDGIMDELIFLLDFKANESRKVTIKTISPKKRLKFPTEVYADLIVKEKDGSHKFVNEVSSTQNNMYNALHHHGVAFESSLIGYRIYFDNKSTIDVYGKKKQQLELAATGWYPTDEQAAAGFGDDVLRVFGSVGVGTVKGWNGKKATHIDKFDKRTQRIVATGNLRTIVESEVEGWAYENKKINMKVRYTLYARHRDAIVELTASEDINNLATGVQTIAGGPTIKTSKGLVGSWGTDFPVTDTLKYEKQSCGLGVYVPVPFAGVQISEGLNNLILMPYRKGEILRFYLTAAAQKEEYTAFDSAEQFFSYLEQWKKGLMPIEVNY